MNNNIGISPWSLEFNIEEKKIITNLIQTLNEALFEKVSLPPRSNDKIKIKMFDFTVDYNKTVNGQKIITDRMAEFIEITYKNSGWSSVKIDRSAYPLTIELINLFPGNDKINTKNLEIRGNKFNLKFEPKGLP